MSDGTVSTAARAHVDHGVHVFHDGSQLPLSASDSIPDVLANYALGALVEQLDSATFLWADALDTVFEVSITRSSARNFLSALVRMRRLDDLPLDLTRRELDVVTLLIGGFTNAQIAESLGITHRTATTHVDHIMRKVGASARSAIATAALDADCVMLPLPADPELFTHLRIGKMARSAGTRGPRKPHATPVPRAAMPLRVGALMPLTGRGRYDAREMLNGAALAIDEINRRGGIHGRSIVMDVVDVDADDTKSVRRGIESLRLGRPDIITSAYLADQVLAMEAASIEGIPFLHASAASMLGRTVAGAPKRYKGVFQVCPNDADYAPLYVDFLTKLRDSGQWLPPSNRIGIAHQSRWDIVDLGLAAGRKRAREAGWELATIRVGDRVNSNSAWSDAATKAQAEQFAAIMVGSFFPTDHAQFLTTFLRNPGTTLIYSTYAPSVPAFDDLVGVPVEGLVWSTTTGTFADHIGVEFAKRYRERFGIAPGRSHAGIAYDRMHIIANAWGQATDPGDFDVVIDRLAETRYRGVNGAYVFDQASHSTFTYGHNSNDFSVSQAHLAFQVQGGKHRLIGPEPFAETSFVAPPWIAGAALAS